MFTLHRYSVFPIMMLLTDIKILVASELIHNMSVMGHKWKT